MNRIFDTKRREYEGIYPPGYDLFVDRYPSGRLIVGINIASPCPSASGHAIVLSETETAAFLEALNKDPADEVTPT